MQIGDAQSHARRGCWILPSALGMDPSNINPC